MTLSRSRKKARKLALREAERTPVELVQTKEVIAIVPAIDSSMNACVGQHELPVAPETSVTARDDVRVHVHSPSPQNKASSSQNSFSSSKNSFSSWQNDASSLQRDVTPLQKNSEGSIEVQSSHEVETFHCRYCRDLTPFIRQCFHLYKGDLRCLLDLKAPVFLLISIGLFPKMVLLWILVIVAKPISFWLYEHIPQRWQENLKRVIPPALKNSPSLRDLSEGADQGLPFILFWFYLCCAPFALIWIAGHWIRGLVRDLFQGSRRGLFRGFSRDMRSTCDKSGEEFVLTQNAKRDSHRSEDNFYYSRAFGIVLFAFFALGIPAFVSFSLYEKLGIEKSVANSAVYKNAMFKPTQPVLMRMPVMGLASTPKHSSAGTLPAKNVTWVQGYSSFWPWLRSRGLEPTKSSMFFVHFYLVSLASALCILFFRAWFTFPLNFVSDEHDLRFSARGIKRNSLKGWFRSVLTINRWACGGGPDSLDWSEIKSLRHEEDGFTKLCPLPETAFKKESLSYRLLNKVAALIDGLTSTVNTGHYVVLSTAANTNDFGRNFKINLNDLNREQRARLYYSIKNWAPHTTVNKSAEEQLLGSSVLQDVRYTQLWFDLLTSKASVKRLSVLIKGETLKDGEYTIEDRLSSGGQATAYLVRSHSGNTCVLKEFILATSLSSGALIESAREFESEVSLLSQLDHPNIVRLQDFFTEAGRVYVALDYIDGRSLRQKVQQDGPLSEREVMQVTRTICDVLEYLHGFNPPIVHRDITPENIIIQPDGTIMLIDFSLAVKDDGKRSTDSCGKQAFTPPEQFREEICPQSDIYALGATMHYLLTGLNPKPISVSSPRAKATHVSTELNAIVERATQLDLTERYESVHWLKLDLANISGAPLSLVART